jgi:hypothetical protein
VSDQLLPLPLTERSVHLCVLELERDPTHPVASLFFRVYVDPLIPKSDT